MDNDETVNEEQQTEIDYDELAKAIDRRTQRTADGALKGILKEKGVSEDEMDEAIKQYKKTQSDKQKEERDRINSIYEENKKYKQMEIDRQMVEKANTLCKNMNVREDRINSLIRLCDQSKFVDEKGVVNEEGMKKELEAQLAEVPEFKNNRVNIYSTTTSQKPQEMTDDEAYRKKKYGKNKYYRG